MKIKYIFEMTDKTVDYTVDFDRDLYTNEGPQWAILDYHKCRKCPLENQTHCPVASDIAPLIELFSQVKSIEKTKITVEMPERTIIKNAGVQEGIRAIFGLIMATSGCPVMNRLKPLAYNHLPFATLDETIEKTVKDYLFKQYLLELEGEETDWELNKLTLLFNKIFDINNDFLVRFREYSKRDSTVNAMISLIIISELANFNPQQLKEQFKEKYNNSF